MKEEFTLLNTGMNLLQKRLTRFIINKTSRLYLKNLGGAEKSSMPYHEGFSNRSRVAERGIQWDA
jgi:hypothetical protein